MSVGVKSVLRVSTSEVFNFTGRMDVPDTGIIFQVSEAEGRFRCRLTLRNWIQVNKRVTSRHLLTLQFERSGEPAQRIDLGAAAPYIRSGGVIQTEIPGGFDPQSLVVKILISDPDRSYQIVVYGRKGHPDVVSDLSEDGSPSVPVRPVRDAPGKGGSLLYTVEAPASGGWNLKLRGVDMPHLVIDPVIGRARLRSDPTLQLAIECEAFRRIVMELASRGTEYDGEAWADKWREFAAAFSGIGDWSYFEEEADDLQALESRVDDAVDAFRRRGNFDQNIAAQGGVEADKE